MSKEAAGILMPPETPGYNTLNYTEQGGAVTHIGGDLIFEPGAFVEGLPLPFSPIAGQEPSTATTIAQLKEDFNALLAKMQESGLMQEVVK